MNNIILHYNTYLFVEVNEFGVRQFKCLDGLQHSVPVPIVDIGWKWVDGVHCIQRDSTLFLKMAIQSHHVFSQKYYQTMELNLLLDRCALSDIYWELHSAKMAASEHNIIFSVKNK